MCNVGGSWSRANEHRVKGRIWFQKGIAKLTRKGDQSLTQATKAQARTMVGASLHEAKAACPALSKAATD